MINPIDELRDFNLPDEMSQTRDKEIEEGLLRLIKECHSQPTTVIVALNDGIILKIDGVKQWYYHSTEKLFFIYYEGNKTFIIAKKDIRYIGDDENLRRFEVE